MEIENGRIQRNRKYELGRKKQFIAAGVVAVVVLVAVLIIVFCGIHRIDEGYVGVYFKGGRLLDESSEPGFNYCFPGLTTYAQVRVTIHTDEVNNVQCTTKDGIVLSFERIEVVNLLNKEAVIRIVRQFTVDYDKDLIFSKIYHEINQLCTKFTLQQVYIDMFDQVDNLLMSKLQNDSDVLAPGLKIIYVRVSKPRIPKELLLKFEEEANRKQDQKVAVEQTLLEKIRLEASRQTAEMQANTEKRVMEIKLARQVLEAEAQKNISRIQNDMNRERVLSEALAELDRVNKTAEGYRMLLTDSYLKYESIKAIGNNTKVFFGDKLPNMFLKSNDL